MQEMMKSIRSFFSNHVAPGGSQIIYHPFSFAWFTRACPITNVSPDAAKLGELTRLIEQANLELDNDNIVVAKRFLAQAITLAESM